MICISFETWYLTLKVDKATPPKKNQKTKQTNKETKKKKQKKTPGKKKQKKINDINIDLCRHWKSKKKLKKGTWVHLMFL